jgi:hypothetical protein
MTPSLSTGSASPDAIASLSPAIAEPTPVLPLSAHSRFVQRLRRRERVWSEALILTGLAFRLREPGAIGILLLIGLCQLLTTPVANHMVGRASFRAGQVRRDLLIVDELSDVLPVGEASPDGGGAAR